MEWKVKFFDYPLQYKAYEKEYLETIQDVLSRGAYILCEDLEKFEKNLAQFVGAKYAIGVSNGTDAILLSLIAAGIKPGDEVITVAHTFVATVEVIKFLGAKPVFVDIADDHNMDVDLVEEKITESTKAIIPVQLNGRICSKMDKLVEISNRYNIPIIEDSAQALGARYKGKCAGTFGFSGNFSFYPSKVLGAFGDAGAVVTNDEETAEKIRALRNHGRIKGTEVMMWGLNCRLDNLQAAILDEKLKKLPKWIERRREIAKMYQEGLCEVKEIKLPPPPVENGEHYDIYQNYEIEAERRDELMVYLRNKGIEVVIQWGGKAVHQFPALGLGDVHLPRTEEMFKKALLLPLYPELTDEQVRYVVHSIKEFYSQKS
jgi:dTDP-4-amino-4,6-dideoxygalactose transaminase